MSGLGSVGDLRTAPRTPLIRYNAAVNAINEATASIMAIPGLRQAWERSQAALDYIAILAELDDDRQLTPWDAADPYSWAAPAALERHFALNDRHDAALKRLRAVGSDRGDET